MRDAVAALGFDASMQEDLQRFFLHSSGYVVNADGGSIPSGELASRWERQLALAPGFISRPSVFVGVLARMMRTERETLVRFVIGALADHPALRDRRFAGRTTLHFAAAAGWAEVVSLLLRQGADANAHGGVTRATPLHMAARRGFAETARALLDLGAAVDAPDRNGVTPLGRAVRCRKHTVAALLVERGARRNLL